MSSKRNAYRVANPERARAMHGLRSSNAAQPHTSKSRKGTRARNNRRAIREGYVA